MNEGIWADHFDIFQVETIFHDVCTRVAPIITFVNRVRIYWYLSKSLSKEFPFGSVLDLLRLSLTKVVIHGWDVGSHKWSRLPVIPDRDNLEISRKCSKINNCNERRDLD